VQAAHYLQSAYGMELVAYSGPENGNRDHHAFVLKSGAARFVVKGACDPASGLVEHHRKHGDGIVDIALAVPDVDRCITHAASQGATILEQPRDISDEHGTVRIASIAAYGDTRHTLVDRSRYNRCVSTRLHEGDLLLFARGREAPNASPGYRSRRRQRRARRDGPMGRLLQPGHGFTNMAEFVGADIATEYSALMSKVVANGNHRVSSR